MSTDEIKTYVQEFNCESFKDNNTINNVCGAGSSSFAFKPKKKKKSKLENGTIMKKHKLHKTEKKKHLLEEHCESELLEEACALNNVKTETAKDFDLEINTELEEHEDVPNNAIEEVIDWPQRDFQELITRIKMIIPEKDTLAYSTRVEKLNWDEIAFNNHSAEKCKKAWLFVQKKIRRFRLLIELLHDANELLTNSWPTFLHKNKRHPDMPKRPLSAYMLFYMRKKDKILADNPGIELPEVSRKIGVMFKNISTTKKEKYLKLAAEERKKYELKLEEFYQNHPDIPRNSAGSLSKAEVGPKKPQTPFGLYYEDQLKMSKPEDDERSSFKEQCKEQWKHLSEKKKLIWIDWALENESKYQDELKKYLLHNPSFTPAPVKPVLSKEEKLLKDKLAGKPKKPPQSAYALFSQMMMQSEDIKKIDIKHRIKAIAEQWKNCTEEEKKRFKEHSDNLLEQYKIDYANYLESLPEDKRKQEIESNATNKRKKPADHSTEHLNNLPKTKPKPTTVSNIEETNNVQVQPENLENTKMTHKEPKRRKRKNSKENPEEIQKNSEDDFLKILQAEPPTPPMSGFDLFSTRYHGKLPVEVAWKRLNKQDKKEYQIEVEVIKETYIKDYEAFLKSLTKEQLTIYSQLKKKARTEQVSGDSSSNCD